MVLCSLSEALLLHSQVPQVLDQEVPEEAQCAWLAPGHRENKDRSVYELRYFNIAENEGEEED